jgi:tetratricopeptide (TPR) repeat protein
MDSTKQSRSLLALAAFLVVAVVAVYAQMRGHDAIHFDDNGYVTNNYLVQRGLTSEGVHYAFTTNTLSNWHPLTWLSHMLDCELFGMDMGMHHLTSLVLHAIDAVLLLLLLHQLTGAVWRSALVAALFALHPLNVESVAWIAERKNVLSTMFWFLTTMSYVAWVRDRKASRYALTLVLFALGLMSKPMLVTLPCTLLLLDYWPLGRMPSKVAFRSLFVEKIPFFALAMASSAVTFVLQRDVVQKGIDTLALEGRIGNAIISYVAYIGKAIWPVDLAVLYPIPQFINGFVLVGAAVVLGLITWLAVRARARHPYLLVGWLWYLGTLVPVIGLVHVGSQTMADRYAYIPHIGVFVMIVWGLGAIVGAWPHAKNTVAAGASLAVIALGVVTWRQTALWKNSVTLFEHSISVTTDNVVLHNAVGTALGGLGRHDDAIAHFKEALRLNPMSPDALNNLGIAFASIDRHDDALKCFEGAIAMKPDSAPTQTSLGLALARLGRTDEALTHYREALRLNPDYPEAHTSLGSLLASLERHDEAIVEFRAALALNPRMLQTHTNLGLALDAKGQHEAAIESFRASLALDPNQPEVHAYLGDVLSSVGRSDEAASHYARVTELDSGNVERNLAIARALLQQGRLNPAIDALKRIVAADPNNVDARIELGGALAARGEVDAALLHLEAGAKSRPGDVETLMKLGLAYDTLGQTERAIEKYRAAISLDPKIVGAHNRLAYALTTARKPDEAIAQFKESLTLEPKQPDVLNILGYIVASQGKLDEAIVHFNEALVLDPNQPQVHINLGSAYQHKGRIDDAIGSFKEALRLAPANADAGISLASALAAQNKLDEAIVVYGEVLAKNPDNVKAHFNVGFLLGRQNKVAEAVKHFEACVRLQPDHALALYQLGVAAAMSGQTPRAIELYREALKHAPENPETLMNLAWIFATNADAKLRDGAEAVRLATKANELLRGQHPGALATLAAALAQEGKFPEATQTAQQALDRARAGGQQALIKTLEDTVQKYSAGQSMHPMK